MDSTDSKSPEKSKDQKKSSSGGGLSASDLRARLGLKSGSRNSKQSGSGDSIRARLGLDASSDQSADLAGPATSRIEKSVLDSLKKGLPPKMAPSGGGPQKSGENTQALSIDEFEDMLVEEEPGTAKKDPTTSDEESLAEALDDVDVDDLFGPNAGAASQPEPEAQPQHAQPEPQPEPVQEAPQQAAPSAAGESAITGDSGALDQEVQDLDLEPEVDPSLMVDESADEDLEGEKTSLLDTSSMFEDDDEFDAFPSEDKTQIMMSAMDYDPLTAKLLVEAGEAPQNEFVLARDKTVIGRGTKSDVVIPDIAMSRKHCVFERYQEGFVVRDLDSGNGTYVNQRRVNYAELRNGDIVELGNVKFSFEQTGGDPDQLWKGEPKLQYHPKDAGPAKSAPAAPSGAVAGAGAGAHPQQHNVPQQQMPQQQMPQQQMPNYQQQGPWGTGMMPAQGGPYGQQQGYPGYPYGTQHQMQQVNQQQRRGSPVVTAAIVFFTILLLGLVGLIVYSLLDQKSGGEEEAAAEQEESPEQKKARARELVNEGSQLFDHRRWDDAQKKFQEALELDPDNQTAKLFVSEVIQREKMTEEQIMKAMNDIRTSPTAANYEKGLQVLSTVDAESTFASEVKNQHLPDVKNAYRKLLVREAQKAIDAKNWPKAKRDLMKVTNDLGMPDDPEVKSLLKQIEIRQKKDQ